MRNRLPRLVGQEANVREAAFLGKRLEPALLPSVPHEQEHHVARPQTIRREDDRLEIVREAEVARIEDDEWVDEPMFAGKPALRLGKRTDERLVGPVVDDPDPLGGLRGPALLREQLLGSLSE